MRSVRVRLSSALRARIKAAIGKTLFIEIDRHSPANGLLRPVLTRRFVCHCRSWSRYSTTRLCFTAPRQCQPPCRKKDQQEGSRLNEMVERIVIKVGKPYLC